MSQDNVDAGVGSGMTLNEYQLEANGFINRPQYNGEMDYFLNTALGLTGESGEFGDIIKKVRFHGHPLTPELRLKLKKELGDVLWYVSQGCIPLECTLEEIADLNLEKLTDRHGGRKFSEAASLNKDEAKEAKTWACGKCDQEVKGLPVTIPKHALRCPKRRYVNP